MKSFSALPLDDRPCNTEQLAALAEVAGVSLKLPPSDLIGTHSPHFDLKGVWAWTEAQFKSTDIFLISIEMLCYGGLVRSRKQQNVDPLLGLEQLRRWMKTYPHVKVYLSNVLLRLSVTVTGDAGEQDWKNIFRFSVLSEEPRTRADELEWQSLRAKIPTAVLQEYLSVRERNHQVNLKVAELHRDTRYLLFGQEDCGPRGLHRTEKKAVQTKINHSPHASVITGADEMQSMLLARALLDLHASGTRVPVQVQWSDSLGAQRISNYEDISVEENLKLHLIPLGLELSNQSSGTIPLKIFAFEESGQVDLCFFKSFEEIQKTELSPSQKKFLAEVQPGDAFLDLSFANGASDPVMLELRSPFDLRSFSAWNTTGNRMGTLLSHLRIQELARRSGTFNPAADRHYLTLRLADDWIFQGRVRVSLNQKCRELGVSIWDLGDQHERLSKLCAIEMKKELEHQGLPFFSASLPWARTFEVALDS